MPAKKKSNNPLPAHPSSLSRCGLLAALVVGGVLAARAGAPLSWMAPIADSAVLPAEAQTSAAPCSHTLKIPGARLLCTQPVSTVTTRYKVYCEGGRLSYSKSNVSPKYKPSSDEFAVMAQHPPYDILLDVFGPGRNLIGLVSDMECMYAPQGLGPHDFQIQVGGHPYTVHFSFTGATHHLEIDHFVIHQACC